MSVKDGAYSNPIEWQQLHDGAEAELELDDAAVDSLKRELHGEVRFDDYNTGAHPPLASACLPVFESNRGYWLKSQSQRAARASRAAAPTRDGRWE